MKEIWEYRELFRSMVVRDLKVKYQRSLLGLIWTLLNPLFTVAILITVFSYIVRIPINNYWAFLISGFFVWNFIAQGLNNATSILGEHADLSRSVYFPREVLILSTAVSKLVEFTFEILIVIIIFSIFHFQSIPYGLIFLPLLILLQLILVIGLMFPVAIISVLFHDVKHALPILITSLFYLSPVFYNVELIPEAMRPYYHLNPFVGILRLYHQVLYEGVLPSMQLLGIVTLVHVAIFVIGYWVFKRYKGVCVEIA